MKVKTATLIGPALDWAAGIADGDKEPNLTGGYDGIGNYCEPWAPSTNPAQGQPILERERINLKNDGLTRGAWWACKPEGRFHQSGPTMLIAGLRCFVERKLGDEVDVPDELM